MRRTHLRGQDNILKRYLVHVAGFNLSLVMRTIFGVGKPKGLQGRAAELCGSLCDLVASMVDLIWLILVNHQSSDPRARARWAA